MLKPNFSLRTIEKDRMNKPIQKLFETEISHKDKCVQTENLPDGTTCCQQQVVGSIYDCGDDALQADEKCHHDAEFLFAILIRMGHQLDIL